MEKDIDYIDNIKNHIIVMRNQPVLLDRDVATIYGVQTKEINQAVRNNPDKFPDGYLLIPDSQESLTLRSKF